MTLVHFKSALLRGVAQGLRRLSEWLLGQTGNESPQPATEETPDTIASHAAELETGVPEDWARRVYREPPLEWVERVRDVAPELLRPGMAQSAGDARPIGDRRPADAAERSSSVKQAEPQPQTKRSKRSAQGPVVAAEPSEARTRDVSPGLSGESALEVGRASHPRPADTTPVPIKTAAEFARPAREGDETVAASRRSPNPRTRHSEAAEPPKPSNSEQARRGSSELDPIEPVRPRRKRAVRISPLTREVDMLPDKREDAEPSRGFRNREPRTETSLNVEAKPSQPRSPLVQQITKPAQSVTREAVTSRSGATVSQVPSSSVFDERPVSRGQISAAALASADLTERVEKRWLDLPDPASTSHADEWAALLRERERLQRLDNEQRGGL